MPFVDSNREFPYLKYDVSVCYRTNYGNLQNPIAGDDEAGADLVKVTAPYTRKIVEYDIVRQGAKPEIPLPEADTDQQVLHESDVIPCANGRLPNGVPVYRRMGNYVYFLAQPILPGEEVPVAAPANYTTTLEDAENVLQTVEWKAGIT